MSDLLCEIGALLRDYQDSWEIRHQESPQGWIAVRRLTPTGIHVLAAHDIATLRAKIEAAQSA